MSDGESARHSSYTSSPSSDVTSCETTSNPSSHEVSADATSTASQQPPISNGGDEQNVMFNLSDPADLEIKLENLTEKEMEELLKQAYKVNKELKSELSRQERVQSGKSHSERPKASKSASAKVSPTSATSRSGLPPIRNVSGKSIGSKGFTSLNHRSSAQRHPSSPVNPSRVKAKTALQQPPPKSRPEWNDRFTL